MKYVTLSELAASVRRNIHKIPHDIDFVIGIPRSGMIPGSMIAEYLNVPLIDVDSFCAGAQPTGGRRLGLLHRESTSKVLVIDDSVFSGWTMNRTKRKLEPYMDRYHFIWAAAYLEGSGIDTIDIWIEDVRRYTNGFTQIILYEWNVFHHNPDTMATCIYDMDGALCLDPPDDRDREGYERYIRDAVPLFTPTVKVSAVVTFRIEHYRDITGRWLADHGVLYGELYMFPAQSREERNRSGISPERFKADYYRAHRRARLFVESDDRQAREIYRMTAKPVLCVESNVMYGNA